MYHTTIASSASVKNWLSGYAQTAGLGHLKEGTPCQDAALAGGKNRPYLIVCDGRGSSSQSHLGSQQAVQAFKNSVWEVEGILRACLDDADEASALVAWKFAVSVFYRSLASVQMRLANLHGTNSAQYEFTVVAAVVGARRIGWFQLGDSCLVIQRRSGLELAAPPQVGPYANMTYFVAPNDRAESHTLLGLCPSADVIGLAGFSDGVTVKLLDLVTNEPSRGVGQILDRLATKEWTSDTLLSYLDQPLWKVPGDDDRSFAYLTVDRNGGEAIY